MGTVRDLVAENATLMAHYILDSFGRVVSQSTPLIQNDIGFAGREFEGTAGVNYFRARFYDPHVGRFTQEDPLRAFDYPFGANNPLLNTDPLGLEAAPSYAVFSTIALTALRGALVRGGTLAAGTELQGLIVAIQTARSPAELAAAITILRHFFGGLQTYQQVYVKISLTMADPRLVELVRDLFN